MTAYALEAVPAFADNYIWMLHDGVHALVVDPGDALPIEEALDRKQLQLGTILLTHHHGDHVGGVNALRSRLTGMVHAPKCETREEPCTRHVEGDTFSFNGLNIRVIDTPGHTKGHIAYVVTPKRDHGASERWLFCGDTLFSAGCGRLFEGSPAQMLESLRKLGEVGDEALVCCTHEYTLSNLRFASAVEPDNADVQKHVAWCEQQRANHLPTLPSTIALERRINPFMRCAAPSVISKALERGAPDAHPTTVLSTLRQWKNEF
jgi:hydroxyacylglutathione hydrolase